LGNYIYALNDENICFKLQKGAIVDLNDEKYSVMTNLITEQDIKEDDLMRQCPHLFQRYFDKEYEVRVTAIGDKITGTAIHSQESDLSKVDYRRYDFTVSYRSIQLPKYVEEFCYLMLKHYELHFGAFDFIVTKKDKEFVFLELNPNGQWLWLEQLSGFKISKVLADYLVS